MEVFQLPGYLVKFFYSFDQLIEAIEVESFHPQPSDERDFTPIMASTADDEDERDTY